MDENPEKNVKKRAVSPLNGVPTPNGRPKGVPNKATTTAREAIARFVDGNTERLQGWLDQIAAESPEKAFNCVRDLMEYHLPKMARTEVTGKDGGPVQISWPLPKTPLDD